jgi:hypothetical protein
VRTSACADSTGLVLSYALKYLRFPPASDNRPALDVPGGEELTGPLSLSPIVEPFIGPEQ